MTHRPSPSLHQEAAVVGWISSTDVMLLCVVMLIGVSLATSKQWEKSEQKTKNLEEEIAKRDAIPDVRSLRDKLESVEKQKADADRRADEAQKAKNDARSELEAEQEKTDRLAEANAAAQMTIATLTEKLNELRMAIAARQVDAEQAEAELSELRAELEMMAARNKRGSAAYKVLRASYEESEGRVAELEGANASLESELTNAENKLADALKQLHGLQNQVASLQNKAEKSLASSQSIKRRLVGLQGALRKVAIVFDASGSMKTGGRWEQACNVATTWVEDLEMDECVLILFSSDVREFPGDGHFLRVSGETGVENRKRLAEYLADIKPVGGTRTRAALEAAYRYPDIDTIILFTDGAPNDGINLENDPREVEAIYSLCDQHKGTPVNTVGLGNYFDRDLSKFLLEVSHRTGGTFLGR